MPRVSPCGGGFVMEGSVFVECRICRGTGSIFTGSRCWQCCGAGTELRAEYLETFAPGARVVDCRTEEEFEVVRPPARWSVADPLGGHGRAAGSEQRRLAVVRVGRAG